MRQIEEYISPLIEGQFPAFYRDEGQMFIAFVKAYYEWAESNLQLLTFEDSTDFNKGDTITQGSQTGKILAVYDSSFLIQLDQFDVFKCNTLCNDLTICTSSSGGSSYISTAKSFNHEYLSRKLVDIRDIDTTIDKFIVSFKNKYLPDIQFNTASNKRLFIKNSLDFYRSKGTERAVDLFFKLIYAIEADVYYPGDDIFKLSDNEYVDVQYLEVPDNENNVQFVGQTIIGADSRATAFVERLVRKRKGSRYIELMYLSNVIGNFQTSEQISTTSLTTNYMSKIIGSVSSAEVVASVPGHQVGDSLSVVDGNGIRAKLRVSEVEDVTGLVQFEVLKDGWGYSSSAEVLGSDKIIRFNNITVENENWFYDNFAFRQFETIQQDLISFTANTDNLVEFAANGTFVPASNDVVTAVNDTNDDIFFGTVVDVDSQTFTVEYRQIDWSDTTAIESITELTVDTLDANGDIVSTNNATVNSSIIVTSDVIASGQTVISYDGSNTEFEGTVVSSNTTSGVVVVNYSASTYANDSIITSITELKNSGNTDTMNVASVSFVNATANVIAISNTSTFNYSYTGDTQLNRFDVLYQKNDRGSEYANAVVTLATANAEQGVYLVDVDRISGAFRSNRPFYRKSDNAEYTLNQISNTSVGVIDAVNSFYPTANTYGQQSGSYSNTDIFSFVTKANFTVSSLQNTQEYYNFYADDAISSANLNQVINSTSYGLSANASIGFDGVISDALSFSNVDIGSLNVILTTNPGVGYLAEPFYTVYDPKSKHLERYDYQIIYSDLEKNFKVGEIIEASNTVSSGASAVITKHDRPNRTIYATRITLPTASFPTIEEVANTALSDITDFTVGEEFTGLDTNITATISYVNEIRRDDRTGLNADISSQTFSGNGYISSVSVIDSGFGYQEGERINAQLDKTPSKISQFDLNLGRQGVAPGYFTSRKGFLSSDKRLHDNDFYQEYSYQVLTSLPFETYKKTLVDVLHVAGTKPFGKYVGTTVVNLGIDITTEVSDFEIGKIDRFDNESTIYPFRVVPTFRPPVFDLSGEIFEPVVRHTLHPSTFTEEQTFYGARQYTLLEPTTLASSESFFTLDVRPTLRPESVTDGDNFFTPVVNQLLHPESINNTQVFETSTVRHTLRPSTETNTSTFETATLDEGFVRPGLLGSGNQFFTTNIIGGTLYAPQDYTTPELRGYVSEDAT